MTGYSTGKSGVEFIMGKESRMAWALMVMEEAGGMKDRGGRVAADSVVSVLVRDLTLH